MTTSVGDGKAVRTERKVTDATPGALQRTVFRIRTSVFRIRIRNIANWTREPRDDARAHGFFTSAGFDTGPDIDRVERPRMIQAHEASVSVGHALLITVPFSALVAASGRAVLTKTAREMRER